MKIVRAVESAITTENLHLNVAATRFGVSPSCVVNWRKKADALSDSSVENNCTLHKGPTSIVSDLKEELLEFIERWRVKGFPITRMGLARKIGRMKPEFLHRSYGARMMAISRFLAANNLTHRVATHKAQRSPGEVSAEALAFLEVQVPRANDPSRHQDFVMNMDQTPVYHSMEGDKTIDAVGAKTINLRTAANDGQRISVAVTLTASGRRVPSMIVFKGELLFLIKMQT